MAFLSVQIVNKHDGTVLAQGPLFFFNNQVDYSFDYLLFGDPQEVTQSTCLKELYLSAVDT